MSEQATEGVRVRILGLFNRFMFDTDALALEYEVIRPNGEKQKRSVMVNRDIIPPVEVELDLS